MCGIVGIIASTEPTEQATRTKRVRHAVDVLRHRGPDAQCVRQIDAMATFGHARLSIIDLDARSDQPFSDATGRFTITYNGEIYNFRALRSSMETLGHRFRTMSDTEVVVQAFAQWGESCVERFDGMFAFAIWDREERALFLARDRFGEKPLYWSTQASDHFVFASELRALEIAHLVPKKEMGRDALNHYLALGYILAPLSAHPDVQKLPAAHCLSWRPGRTAYLRSYWSYADAFRRPRSVSYSSAVGDVRDVFREAVASRLVADVPIGSFLSGGLDSSYVTAVASQVVSYPLQTFSVGFAYGSYDESDEALRVANALNTVHTAVRLDATNAYERARLAALVYDEPFADTSLVPMVEVARAAAAKVRVVTSGDGADEIFAGYATYQADRLMQALARLPRTVRAGLQRAPHLFPNSHKNKTSTAFKLRQFANGVHRSSCDAHYAWREIRDLNERIAIIGFQHADEVIETSPGRTFSAHYDSVRDLSPLSQHLYVDAKTWLVDCILVKVDRATMAASLEARTPYLALSMVMYAASLPDAFKLRLFRGKRVLRAAASSQLLRRTIQRSKAGFSAPINRWFDTYEENEYRTFNRHVLNWHAERRRSAIAGADNLGSYAC